MQAAITTLEIALGDLENNELINRREGASAQADLEANNAREIREGLQVLRLRDAMSKGAKGKIRAIENAELGRDILDAVTYLLQKDEENEKERNDQRVRAVAKAYTELSAAQKRAAVERALAEDFFLKRPSPFPPLFPAKESTPEFTEPMPYRELKGAAIGGAVLGVDWGGAGSPVRTAVNFGPTPEKIEKLLGLERCTANLAGETPPKPVAEKDAVSEPKETSFHLLAQFNSPFPAGRLLEEYWACEIPGGCILRATVKCDSGVSNPLSVTFVPGVKLKETDGRWGLVLATRHPAVLHSALHSAPFPFPEFMEEGKPEDEAGEQDGALEAAKKKALDPIHHLLQFVRACEPIPEDVADAARRALDAQEAVTLAPETLDKDEQDALRHVYFLTSPHIFQRKPLKSPFEKLEDRGYVTRVAIGNGPSAYKLTCEGKRVLSLERGAQLP